MTEGLENTGSKGGRSQDSSLPLLITDEIAPLSLPYILLCKTQGRRVNTFNGRNRVVYISFPLSVSRSIVGHGNGGGLIKQESISPKSLECGYRQEF